MENNVDNQQESNGKLLGGITGKGFMPGVSGNPEGRPKQKTIKEMVREWLDEHPDDMISFVKHFSKKNRELAWQMLEGKPQQDVTSDGKALPIPIINVQLNDGDTKDTGPHEAD